MNLLKEAGHVLATIAPTIATAVGGPFAGMAVSKLQQVFGLTPGDASQAAVEQALTTATPDQILALREAENSFTVQMEQLGISKQQLVYQDIANARAREIAVKDTTPRNLAYAYTVGFFATLAGQFAIVLLGLKVDPTALRLLDTTTGVLFAMMLGTKEYYFGSSAGSDKKTDALAALAKK